MPRTGWDDQEWPVAYEPRLTVALRLLAATCEPGASVADLGCLYGGYTVAFARAGYDATGIDARASNFAHCQEQAQEAGLPNLRFICDDVRNLADHGPFDAVFCCGLFYHLDQPVKFLSLLGQVTRKLLILNTHYSLGGGAENEGRQGHWFTEGGAGDAWASWGNTQSFWLTKPALLEAIDSAGFGLTAEIHSRADINGSGDRVTLAAIKS